MRRPFVRLLASSSHQSHAHAVARPPRPSISLDQLFPQRPGVQDDLFAQRRGPRGSLAFPASSGASIQPAASEHDSAYQQLVRRYLASSDLGDAKSLHLEWIKSGFTSDVFLSNNVVNLYAKAGDLATAAELFDEMPEKDAVSWTCLISGCARHGLCDESCHFFRSMLRSGIEPSQLTFTSVLRACGVSGPDRLLLGTQVHGLISKTSSSISTLVCNALILMYGSCRLDSASNARRVFDWTSEKSSITWNSIISVYSERGDAESAFELFSEMQMGNSGCCLRPDEFTYGSLITATYGCFYACSVLEQMLAYLSKSGFSRDLYVGSALVSAFARSGMLDRAKEIFCLLDEKNAVSMNGLMVGLIKRNLGEAAVDVYREARRSVIVNADSYVILLSALSAFSALEEGLGIGREIHGYVIRNRLIEKHVAIGNGLINVYAKYGDVDNAAKVFSLLRVKDQVSWNTMITCLDQNGLSEEALTNFHLMLRNGVLPSKFSVISTLSSCARLRLTNAGVQCHCILTKVGLDMDVSVSNSLLTMYGECGKMSDCWRVFSYMIKHDLISWNSIIGALASNGAFLMDSVRIFLDMMRSGWYPNNVTIINVFAAVSALSDLGMSRQVHNLVLKHRMSEDIVVENSLLSSYSKSGDMDSCERLFYKMADRRNGVSWNSMISGYIQNGLMQKTMDLVYSMIRRGPKMDSFTFATVLSACASLAVLDHGMEIHAFGIRTYLEIDVVVGSALVDMYAKCGRVDYASRVFESMNLRNEFSWNSMISGYARHGNGDEALKLFNKMQSSGQCPDLVTYVGVLSACSHAGLVEEGLEHFESMKNHSLVPQIEHYSCVIDLLGRTGKLDEMEDFIIRMPLRPNDMIWRTVLVACHRSKDGAKREIAKQASKMLLEVEPENPVNYVLISNMFSSKARWEDAARIRKVMQALPVKKEAGCSWVTLQDGLHVFVSGDKSHPNTEKIYAKLHFLIQKIREIGYVPQVDFSLYDIELETKEELLSYHSEKLAVAFVLSHSSTIPIRIMKNLRVCGDCHSAFCYISKIVERRITLRDSIRFHHFEDGRCSCGDFW
ncbi:putative pentatricopeptide repeat-containing protein At5g09950 [Zingiber officinale]|nr:putative pentatricopeptide repeat-containing protein At5g09950 [Zingiber officinale]